MRVEVEGGWADIRDPRKLTEAQSEPMDDAQYELLSVPGAAAFMEDAAAAENIQTLPKGQQIAAIGAEGFKALRNLRRQTVLAYVAAWSAGDVVDMATLMQQPVTFVTGIENEITKVVKATGGPRVDTSPNPDPASPTVPSTV